MKIIKEKYDIKDGAHEAVGPVMADAMRSLNRTNKIRKDYIDDAFERVTDKKMHGPVNHNPKRSAVSKKMMLSESLFDNIDGEYFKDEADYIINRIDVTKFIDKYDSFGSFVDNEFSVKVLGGFGSTDEMEELYKYFEINAPEQTKIGKRLWPNNLTENKKTKKSLTKDELKKLRSEISLNSLYTNDYENSFGFKPEDAQMFFDSYLEELEEILIEEHNFNKDEIELQDLLTVDTIDNLYNYYMSFENLPF